MELQLELFKEDSDISLHRELARIQKDLDKYRKSQFAKISEIKRQNDETKHELKILKEVICQGSRQAT